MSGMWCFLFALCLVPPGDGQVSAAAEEAVRLQAVPQAFSRYDARAYALAELPEFRRALDEVLPGDAPGWLRGLQGPSPAPAWVEVDGTGYVVVRSCRPHACAWDRVVIFFQPQPPYRLVGLREVDPDEDGPRSPVHAWLGAAAPEERKALMSVMSRWGRS